MPAPFTPENIATLIENLLTCETPVEQTSLLQAQNALNPEALAQLLQQAMPLARRNPRQAAQLATLCADLAPQAAAPALLPQAHYILAQTLAIGGDFNAALQRIEQAHNGYAALGDQLHAQRTNLGRIHVLNELGRHQEALQNGQAVLDWLAQNPQPDNPEMQLMTVLAHNNRGVCFRRMGQYDHALSAYEAAERHALSGGFQERLGDIRSNRGLILQHIGRVSEALDAFSAAAAVRQTAGLTLLHAESLINCGEAHLLLGQYTPSLDALRQAERLLQSLDAPASLPYVWLHQADVYLALNLAPEALAAYGDAVAAFHQRGMAYYEARALWGAGAALLAQGHWPDAETQLAQAAAYFVQAGNVPLTCGVRLELAALWAAQGAAARAIAAAQDALTQAVAGDWPVQQVYAHLRLADLQQEDTAVANHHLLAAQTLLQNLPLPHLQYRLSQRLGQLRRRQGQMDEARLWLETAVAQIEQLRGTVAQEAMRVSFQHDKVDAYEELLALYLAQNDPVAAFTAAEQAKSRTLLELLAGVQTPSFTETQHADRIAALQADLNALYNDLLGTAVADEADWQNTLAHRRARAQQLEQELQRLRLQQPAASDPLTAVPPYAALRAQLPADLTLLAYHILGDEIIAFVSTAEKLEVVRGVGSVTAVSHLLQHLHIQWERFRVGPAFVQRHMPQLLASAQRIL
ncbi:MAG: tetratricopeptide repeat protein, partial [Ardenticatenaceae bacterium]|nr:tetratricopeptide repeat protein [Ardenticatenaceae bacterium]